MVVVGKSCRCGVLVRFALMEMSWEKDAGGSGPGLRRQRVGRAACACDMPWECKQQEKKCRQDERDERVLHTKT